MDPDMGQLCLRLCDEDEAAATAVICQARDEEMGPWYRGCGDGPFGRCVVLPDRLHNACSNCIAVGRQRSCEWWTRDDRSSDEDYQLSRQERSEDKG